MYNGGSNVIDYMVLYAEESSGTYIEFSTNQVLTTETVTGLTPGTSYKFIVRSRNIIGHSSDSSQITVLAA